MSSYRILEIFQSLIKVVQIQKIICKYYLKNFISKNPIFFRYNFQKFFEIHQSHSDTKNLFVNTI